MFLGLLDFLNTCESCVCGIVIESDTTRKPKIRGRKWPPITLKPNKNLKFLTKTQPEPEKRYPKVTQTRHFLPNLITSMECGYTSNLNWWLHYENFWFQKQPFLKVMNYKIYDKNLEGIKKALQFWMAAALLEPKK